LEVDIVIAAFTLPTLKLMVLSGWVAPCVKMTPTGFELSTPDTTTDPTPPLVVIMLVFLVGTPYVSTTDSGLTSAVGCVAEAQYGVSSFAKD
jgi:hypothetical protein